MERRAPELEPDAADAPRPVDDVALPNGYLFWPVVLLVLAADVITKAIAVNALAPQLIAHEVIGTIVQFTLVYNPGAAFGIHVGPYSRLVFSVLTVVALTILWRLYRGTGRGDWRRALALALVTSGAVGNLIDRVRSSRGVVDFIDIGFGGHRWPTFNIADVAVTSGAVLLAVVLWREDRAREAAERAAAASATAVPLVPRSGEST
jgi:signal peptidase II